MVDLEQVVFAFDFERIVSSGGVRYLWDYSPNGFHFAFPGGAADPTPQLDGSLLFDGTDYLALPATQLTRFYSKMPTREHTWLCMFRSTADSNYYLWSCWDSGAGGTHDGLLLLRGMAGDDIQAYQMQGGAGTPQATSGTGVVPPTTDVGFAFTVETAPRCMVRGARPSAIWTAGSFGTTTYDTTIVPRVGMNPNGGSPLVGRLSCLALIRGALSNDDLEAVSAAMMDGRKPFCWREPA